MLRIIGMENGVSQVFYFHLAHVHSMKSKVKQVEACMRELKLHGMVVEAGLQEGQQAYVLTNKAINAINDAMHLMRKRYPEASEEDIKVKALIFVVLNNMGLVMDKSMLTYMNILNSLSDWKLIDQQ